MSAHEERRTDRGTSLRRRDPANARRATPANPVRIRRATAEDLDTIVALRLALIRESEANLAFRRLRTDAESRARELYGTQLTSDRETTFLAFDEDRAIGIIRCVESSGSPMLHPSRYCYVSSAYVVPEFRRRGILRALMRSVDEWCARRGLREMRLHNIAESDEANGAWSALGFDVTEHVRVRMLPG